MNITFDYVCTRVVLEKDTLDIWVNGTKVTPEYIYYALICVLLVSRTFRCQTINAKKIKPFMILWLFSLFVICRHGISILPVYRFKYVRRCYGVRLKWRTRHLWKQNLEGHFWSVLGWGGSRIYRRGHRDSLHHRQRASLCQSGQLRYIWLQIVRIA